MLPYVTRVLQHPNNWMVHSMGLLLKARLEAESLRTRDRAALQLQVGAWHEIAIVKRIFFL